MSLAYARNSRGRHAKPQRGFAHASKNLSKLRKTLASPAKVWYTVNKTYYISFALARARMRHFFTSVLHFMAQPMLQSAPICPFLGAFSPPCILDQSLQKHMFLFAQVLTNIILCGIMGAACSKISQRKFQFSLDISQKLPYNSIHNEGNKRNQKKGL